MDRLDQLLSKLRRRYRAGQAVPKNIARHLTRIALALSMCLQHQLAAFHPIPRPSTPKSPSLAPAQPNREAAATAAGSALAEQPLRGLTSSIDQPPEAAAAGSVQAEQLSHGLIISINQPIEADNQQLHASAAPATTNAQLEAAPSQPLPSDQSAPVGSQPGLISMGPAAPSPTESQVASAENGPHAGDVQQRPIAASVAGETPGVCSKDPAAAEYSPEEQPALEWQQSVQQVLQLMRQAVAMWKLAQQLQPNHKGRKRMGAVFLLASPLSPAGMEAGSADDPAALLDLASSNLRR